MVSDYSITYLFQKSDIYVNFLEYKFNHIH